MALALIARGLLLCINRYNNLTSEEVASPSHKSVDGAAVEPELELS